QGAAVKTWRRASVSHSDNGQRLGGPAPGFVAGGGGSSCCAEVGMSCVGGIGYSSFTGGFVPTSIGIGLPFGSENGETGDVSRAKGTVRAPPPSSANGVATQLGEASVPPGGAGTASGRPSGAANGVGMRRTALPVADVDTTTGAGVPASGRGDSPPFALLLSVAAGSGSAVGSPASGETGSTLSSSSTGDDVGSGPTGRLPREPWGSRDRE